MIDYLAGMTDRFAIRAWTERAVPQGLLGLAMPRLHRRLARSASATRSTSSSSSARARSCASPAQRRYTGLCPFHDERTPSFGIDPVEKLYHCFGCGEGGDVFKFVMETEGLDFAVRAGVAGRPRRASSSRPRRRTRRRPSGATARAGCSRCSSAPPPTTCACCGSRGEAADAREYLLGRGLTEGALRQFRVGYSPSGVGHGAERLAAGGLRERGGVRGRARRCAAREGRIYDVFRGKVMFPLADRRGRVRGFGARAMRDGQGPKYVNTREGEVFPKGRQLFGDRPRARRRPRRPARSCSPRATPT